MPKRAVNRSVLITKNGRPSAALVPVTEDTDLEALALSRNKRFWKLIDDAIARGKKGRLHRSGGSLGAALTPSRLTRRSPRLIVLR